MFGGVSASFGGDGAAQTQARTRGGGGASLFIAPYNKDQLNSKLLTSRNMQEQLQFLNVGSSLSEQMDYKIV